MARRYSRAPALIGKVRLTAIIVPAVITAGAMFSYDPAPPYQPRNAASKLHASGDPFDAQLQLSQLPTRV